MTMTPVQLTRYLLAEAERALPAVGRLISVLSSRNLARRVNIYRISRRDMFVKYITDICEMISRRGRDHVCSVDDADE